MWERREEIEKKYDKILEEEMNVDPYDLDNLVYADDKNEEYFAILNAFKSLFSRGEEAQIYLWNKLFRRIDCSNLEEMDKADFSAEEWQLLESIAKAYQAYRERNGAFCCNRNINRQIETDRLVLTTYNEELNNRYIDFFTQHPDEYERYYGLEYDEKIIGYNCNPIKRNLTFAVLLKKTKEFIGSVALTEQNSGAQYNLEYFTMPEHRQKGYAREAVQRLIDEAFNDKLIIVEETVREGVFNQAHPPIGCIIAQIVTTNEPSIKFIEKLGFKNDDVFIPTRKLHGNNLHYYSYTLKKEAYFGQKIIKDEEHK